MFNRFRILDRMDAVNFDDKDDSCRTRRDSRRLSWLTYEPFLVSGYSEKGMIEVTERKLEGRSNAFGGWGESCGITKGECEGLKRQLVKGSRFAWREGCRVESSRVGSLVDPTATFRSAPAAVAGASASAIGVAAQIVFPLKIFRERVHR
uniref:Uncharacterized protein n=1 Tax=Vespula pensylvanica TaxID=30213 RepID=A0A834N2E9_VESPE|nr:hypothetical protein H0235_016840 [Vespula pensylvanica]